MNNYNNSQTFIQIPVNQFIELRDKIDAIYRKVENFTQTPTNNSKDNNLMTANELCQWLGVSKVTLWRHEKNRLLTPLKIGKTKVYDINEVKQSFGGKN